MTQMRRFALFLVLAMISILMVGDLCLGAERYPTKPIQVIVPYAPGGAVDLLARCVEKIWPKYSTQPLLIISKPGAGGVQGTEYVVNSKPDGYTLLLGHGNLMIMANLMKLPFDVFKDIAPVSRLTVNPVVICVSGKSPFKSMKDLIAWANNGNRVTAAVSTEQSRGAVRLPFVEFTPAVVRSPRNASGSVSGGWRARDPNAEFGRAGSRPACACRAGIAGRTYSSRNGCESIGHAPLVSS